MAKSLSSSDGTTSGAASEAASTPTHMSYGEHPKRPARLTRTSKDQTPSRKSGHSRTSGVVLALSSIVLVLFAATLCMVFCALILIDSGTPLYQLLQEGLTIRRMALALAFIVLFGAIVLMVFNGNRLLGFLFRFRYVFGMLFLVVAAVFELSGSSIGIWSTYLGGDDGVLLGVSRWERGDEWIVFTPFAFSQELNGYASVSEIIRGTETDITLVYGQPAWALPTLFRPFLWGYLLLGSSHGLAFFWTARLLALFFVTFEFARLLTRDNKRLSLAFACLIAFAPIVQWWFAINGIVELFVFGEALVMLLWHFLRTRKKALKWLYALLMAWCAGCYLFVLYPAWQIPLFYVFALLGVWVGIEYRRNRNRLAKPLALRYSIIPLMVAVCALCIAVGVSLASSWDALQAVMNTAYPGARVETGGEFALELFKWPISFLSSLVGFEMNMNACELASFVSLFPLGSLLALYALAKTHDSFLGLMLALQAILLAYVCIGFPLPLAKLTLLSYAPSGRAAIAIGFTELLLLFRCLVVLPASTALDLAASESASEPSGFQARTSRALSAPKPFATPKAPSSTRALVAFTLVFSAVVALTACGIYWSNIAILPGFYCALLFVLALAVFGVGFVFVAERGSSRACSLILFCCVILSLSGLFVNPLRTGADVIEDSELGQAITEVVSQDEEALWLTDNDTLGQLCIMFGAHTATSVNVYPDLERWGALDKNGEAAYVYNRYAHISVIIADDEAEESTDDRRDAGTDENSDDGSAANGNTDRDDDRAYGDQFYLTAADAFTVTLTRQDLATLGVRYLLTQRDDLQSDGDTADAEGDVASSSWNDDVTFTLVSSVSGYHIYRLDYYYADN